MPSLVGLGEVNLQTYPGGEGKHFPALLPVSYRKGRNINSLDFWLEEPDCVSPTTIVCFGLSEKLN